MVRMNVQVNIYLVSGKDEEIICDKEELLPVVKPLPLQLQPDGSLEFTLKFTREDVGFLKLCRYRIPLEYLEGYNKFFLCVNEDRELLLILDENGLTGKRYLYNFVVEEISSPRC